MEFRILGPLEVTDDGRRLELGRGRQNALLVLLLLHANEVVLIDRIVEELWPSDPPGTATKIVQGYVVQLRKVLGDRLITRRSGYVLELERNELDAAQAGSLLEEGRSALGAGYTAEASETLTRALALWRGPPLADFAYDSFAQADIARLEDLRLEILEERSEADLALGRHASLVGQLQTVVAQHPLRERPRAQLMTALYRSGRQAEALEIYRDTQRMLGEELGLEPGPALRELEHAILTHDPLLAAPAGVRAVLARPARGRPLVAVLALATVTVAASAGLIFALTREETSSGPTVNYVEAVDPQVNRPVGRIAVGERPTEIVASSNGVWVLNADAGTVSAIDAKTRTLLRTAAVGIGPTDLAFDGRVLWVTDSRLRRVFRLDAQTLAVTRGLRFPQPLLRHGRRGFDPVEVGGLALGDRSLWVSGGGDNLFRLDPTTGRVIANVAGVAAVSGPAKGIVVTGTSVWVRGCCAKVTRVDAATNSVAAVIPLGAGSHEVPGLAAGAGAVWVTDASFDLIWEIDPQASAVVRTIPTGPSPAGIAVGFGSVWVANGGDGTVWRLDPVTGKPEAKIHVGGSPAGVAVGADRVWVTVD
jgi:YVTN family beta-propeller protein